MKLGDEVEVVKEDLRAVGSRSKGLFSWAGLDFFVLSELMTCTTGRIDRGLLGLARGVCWLTAISRRGGESGCFGLCP